MVFGAWSAKLFQERREVCIPWLGGEIHKATEGVGALEGDDPTHSPGRAVLGMGHRIVGGGRHRGARHQPQASGDLCFTQCLHKRQGLIQAFGVMDLL